MWVGCQNCLSTVKRITALQRSRKETPLVVSIHTWMGIATSTVLQQSFTSSLDGLVHVVKSSCELPLQGNNTAISNNAQHRHVFDSFVQRTITAARYQNC